MIETKSVARKLMEENPPEEFYPNVFDWNENLLFYVYYPKEKNVYGSKVGFTSRSATRSMISEKDEDAFTKRDLVNTLDCLKDAKTGEIVPKVIAYDAGRGLVTRILLDESGNRFMDATTNEIAKTTEKRYLVAEGGELADLINYATKEAMK